MTWRTWQREWQVERRSSKKNSSYLGTRERDVDTTAAVRGLRRDALPSLCFCFRVLLPEKSANMCICRTLRRARWSEICGRKFPQRHQSVTGRSAGGGLVKVNQQRKQWSSRRLYTGNVAHVCNVTFDAKSHIHISPKEEEKMWPKILKDIQLLFPFPCVCQVSKTTFWTIDFIFIHLFTFTFVSACVSIFFYFSYRWWWK